MELLEQCRIWNRNGDFSEVIRAVGARSETEQTPELICELARAQIHAAAEDDRETIRRSIERLRSVEDRLADCPEWNSAIGFAYYRLQEDGIALNHLLAAQEAAQSAAKESPSRSGEADPEGRETERLHELIEACVERLTLPTHLRSFRRRTEDAWNTFVRREGELRALAAAGKQDETIALCSEILSEAFSAVSFEIGAGESGFELILSPEGDPDKLRPLAYFVNHAPDSVRSRWKLTVGRPRSLQPAVRAFGLEIAAEDVRAWYSIRPESPARVALSLYCEKLMPLLRSSEGQAWWILSNLTDQSLGELASMASIADFRPLIRPEETDSVTLRELPRCLEAEGIDLGVGPNHFIGAYRIPYPGHTIADLNELRADVRFGVTGFPMLVRQYDLAQSEIVDRLYRDGIIAGFFYYPLSGMHGDTAPSAEAFREALEAFVKKAAGEDTVCFIGGAAGDTLGYVDWIAWDLLPVLQAAGRFFRGSGVRWGSFHPFRRGMDGVLLYESESGEA